MLFHYLTRSPVGIAASFKNTLAAGVSGGKHWIALFSSLGMHAIKQESMYVHQNQKSEMHLETPYSIPAVCCDEEHAMTSVNK